MVDKLEVLDANGAPNGITAHRVEAAMVPSVAPLLMAPATEACRPLAAAPSRPFYVSDELADHTVLAVSSTRRSLWPALLDEVVSERGFTLRALKVLPKLSPTLATALWLPEDCGAMVCLLAAVGGTATLQSVQASVSSSSDRMHTPRGGGF